MLRTAAVGVNGTTDRVVPLRSPLAWSGKTVCLGSTRQRNTLIEHFCWGTEVQRLARPLVQLKNGPVQIRLRAGGQVVVSKTDLCPHLDTGMEALRGSLCRINRSVAGLELSSQTGEGLDAWLDWLRGALRSP
jgi:hypothetical protein